MTQAIPLKVKQLGEILMRCPQRDLESIVRVVVHAPGSVGGTPSAAVIGAQFGFDWDSGSLLISTDEKLTRLSPEDVLAINDSVRKGTSWHAYQSWKKQEDRITALEASHLEELRAYELTVSNLRAELESVRQGQCLMQIAEPAAPLVGQQEVDLPDVDDMAHSALEEALSFGLSHDVLHRWMQKVMRLTQEALATHPTPQGLDAQIKAARNTGINHGVCLALQIMTAAGDAGSTQWEELVSVAGRAEIEHHAKYVEPEEWELGGFAQLERSRNEDLALDAALEAQDLDKAKRAEAMDAARNGGCGCCGNACADRTDGCRFIHESPSAADIAIAAQAKQGGA